MMWPWGPHSTLTYGAALEPREGMPCPQLVSQAEPMHAAAGRRPARPTP